jgi:CheY-like chemotaxis protein
MPKTLLLADDSVTIQKVVAISFASEDIAITTVDNGDDAITRAREERPDVILADVVMPGKSGYEVCEAIQADPSLRHIPVLLLTGTFEAFDEERAQSAGAAGHVAKPFEAQALVARVRELLARPPVAAPEPVAPAAEPTVHPPAAAPPQVAPAPATSDPDDAFDFFDDDPVPADDRTQEFGAATLDVQAGDSAFSFGDDDLDEASDPLMAPDLDEVQPAAHTVAILPDAPPAPPAPGGADTVLAMPTDAPISADDDIEFEFESLSSRPAPVANVEGVAEGAVLDPAADSGFVDPGDDDLAVPSGLEAPEATQILSSPFESVGAADDDDEDYEEEYEEEYEEDEEEEAIASPESYTAYEDALDDRDDDLLSPEPIDPEPIAVEASPIPDPNRARMDPIDPRMPEEAAPVDPSPGRPDDLGFSEPEPVAAAFAEPEPVATSFYEPEPARAAFTESDPITEPTAEPPTAATILPDPEATAAAVLAQVAPELRAQLHDTLERIAWEAFGQVTEKLVKQAIDRVEKAAWEVVPKLAETLILEEIRKLKGE